MAVSKPEGTEIRGTASRVHKSCNRKHGNLVDNPPNQQSYEVTSQICRKHKIIGQSAGKHIKNCQELSLGNIGKFTRSSHQVLHLPCCGLGSLAWRWNRWLVAQLPMSESLESAAIPTAWKAFVMRCSGLCSATAMPGREAKVQGGTCFVTINFHIYNWREIVRTSQTSWNYVACSCNWFQCGNPSCRESRALPDFSKVKFFGLALRTRARDSLCFLRVWNV